MTATQIDTRLWNFEDMVRKLGFDTDPEQPTSPRYREQWYVRQARGGVDNVRVTIHPDDGYRVEVYYFHRHWAVEWTATFNGAPWATVRATLRQSPYERPS